MQQASIECIHCAFVFGSAPFDPERNIARLMAVRSSKHFRFCTINLIFSVELSSMCLSRAFKLRRVHSERMSATVAVTHSGCCKMTTTVLKGGGAHADTCSSVLR